MFSFKRSATLAAIVLGAGTFALAQTEDNARPITPKITHAAYAMAVNPGTIEIRGVNLGVIQEVRLDGVVIPVQRNNGHSLWIAPGPQDPGFGELKLFYPRGVLTDMVSFTPTLAADHRPSTIALTLDSGDAGGFYMLNWSMRVRSTPITRPGIYYMDFLDMTTTYSGMVGSGFFDERYATEMFGKERMALIARPVYFQGLCTADDGQMCFTNPVVVYHGKRSPSDPPQLGM